MEKYIVIGNPIDHSLSPKLHNHWFKENNINAIYDKKKIETENLNEIVLSVKEKKINGVNVTTPFKHEIIPFLDKLSPEAKSTNSVNTIYLDKDKTIGHNTDIEGFEDSMKAIKFEVENKKVQILGAGGVVPSIIFALNKMKSSKITLSNRTKDKAEKLKETFKNLEIIDWGNLSDFDMIINATSLGLKKTDKINLDFSKIGKNKFFYDIIYNPKETDFLKAAKSLNYRIENGKMMFILQAAAAFKIWHGINPIINKDVLKLLD